MPVFNVSFLNPKLRKSSGGSGVGILSDQLSILQSQLSKDGYLSGGDYDLLIKKAQEIRNNPGLSSDQRSNFDVKIANFESLKSVAAIEKDESIERLKKIKDDEQRTNVLLFGNNPDEFLGVKDESLLAYINDLSESIERRMAASQDPIEYQNELSDALMQYNELADMKESYNSRVGAEPIGNYVAYVETNSRGEITDIDYAKTGAKNGFIPTNGVMNGFQVYGKANAKKNGQNYFYLGNNTFYGSDMVLQNPLNPGILEPSMMIDAATQTGDGKNKVGILNSSNVSWKNIDGNSIQVQSYIPRNAWARGANGTLYNRRDDGGYTKYVNTMQSKPEIPETGIINLPSNYEQLMMRKVDQTIDGAEPIMPNTGLNYTPMPESGSEQLPDLSAPLNQSRVPVETAPAMSTTQSISRTPSPVERAPQGFFQNAKRTVASAIDSLRANRI